MTGSFSLESVLRRDRAVVLAGLAAVTLPAWAYMIHEARAMYDTGVCACAGLQMFGPDTEPWSAPVVVPLFLMWAGMMVAMMVPSVAPVVLTFALVNRKRREQQRPFVPAGVFLLGYLLVWTAFSAIAALAQWVLHSQALLSPMMVSTSPMLGAAFLIGAGGFQLTSLKNACLSHCRSPLGFLMTGWRDGKRGALAMGVKHGAYCTGCCWILMALLFVAGVMNILWIALITALVVIEKAAPRGPLLGRIAGGILIVWGLWLAASSA